MIAIRKATIEDIEGIVKVNTKVWQSAYDGIIHKHTLDALKDNLEERVQRFRDEYAESEASNKPLYQAVAVEDGNVIGFIKYGDYRNDDIFAFDRTAEVYAIYVDNTYQRKQVGKRLINFALVHLLELGRYESMVVWTLKENTFRAFYESIGGKSELARTISIRNQRLEEVGYTFESLNDSEKGTR